MDEVVPELSIEDSVGCARPEDSDSLGLAVVSATWVVKEDSPALPDVSVADERIVAGLCVETSGIDFVAGGFLRSEVISVAKVLASNVGVDCGDPWLEVDS